MTDQLENEAQTERAIYDPIVGDTDDLRARARGRPSADGLPGLQVDRAAPPQAAARLPAADDHRDDRPAARTADAVDRRARQRPHPPARRASRSASGSSSRVACSTPRASRCAARWSRSGRPTPAGATCTSWDRWPAPLDPNFSGAGRCVTDDRGPLLVHDDQAGAVSVGQPLQRLAPRAHPLLAARAARSPSGW